jgi:hypothetical protein
MQNHVMLFEEFLSNPTEEAALLRQFKTSETIGNVVTTHQVSQIKSDETGIRVAIGNQDGPAGEVIPLPTYKQNED